MLLSLLAIPVYVNFLGLEAYGVVGFFISLSLLLNFLDLGLGSTLVRHLAKNCITASQNRIRRDTVRTFECVYAVIALVIGLSIFAITTPLANQWIQPDSLDRKEIAIALAIAGFSLCCQWPSNLYTLGLTGLQRDVHLGYATIFLSTLRTVLTVCAIWLYPTLHSFFLAQLLSSVVQTIVLRLMLWKAIATIDNHRPMIRLKIIKSSFNFASGMTGIAITSIFLTQIDKIILSRILSLTDFGIYSVASSLATAPYMLISPIHSVMYPRFASLIEVKSTIKLTEMYHLSSQALGVLVIPFAILISLYSHNFLSIWTSNNQLASRGALILSFLVIGNACNGLMNMPYALQIASGWTRLALLTNVWAILILSPAIWWAGTTYGAIGGAMIWMLLNLGYILVTPNLMHQRLLTTEKFHWYKYGIIVPICISVGVLFVLFQFQITELSTVFFIFLIAVYWIITITVCMFFLPLSKKLFSISNKST